MKKILIALLLTTSILFGQGGIKLGQLAPCIKGGVKTDSCFIVTDANGVPYYITYQQFCSFIQPCIPESGKVDSIYIASDSTVRVVTMSGSYTVNWNNVVKKYETVTNLLNAANGSYYYTNEKGTAVFFGYRLSCVNDSTLSITDLDGTVVNTCVIKGGANPDVPLALNNVTVESDSTVLLHFTDGTTAALDVCNAVKKCETVTNLTWDNINKWYTYTDEKGVAHYFGYKLSCVNDSTISITDINNNTINTCVIRGGSNPNVPTSINDITVENDSTVLLHFTDGGTAPLDICNAVKKCETVTYISWDYTNNWYTYVNEKGQTDTIIYRMNVDSISSNGYVYFQGNGKNLDSFNLCNPNCPPLQLTTSDDNYATNDCTVPYCGNLAVNDNLCSSGVSTFSLVTGTNQNGFVNIDASGDFCFTFTTCDPNLDGEYMYQVQCKDGTTSISTVTIDLQDACGSALAEQDNTQIPKNGTVSLNLALNDTQCGAGSVTMWKKKTNPNHGTIVVNMDGTSIITAMANYVGSDSCIYELWCNNQLCDTAFIKWNVWEASATDNYYNPLAGVPFPFNATADDVACTPPLVTSYAWSGSLVPISAGAVSGTPTSGTFTSAAGFCGTASRPYAQLCDADTVNKARVYFNVICALAVNDEFSTQGDTVNANVSTNDIACTNGGITTYHLVSNPTAHGYGLNIPVYQCSGDCPSGTTIVAHLTHWDTLTGAFTLDTTTYSKDMCFRYFIRCKNTVPQMATMDTGCVKILSQLPISQDSILITMPNNTIPSFTVRIGAWCDKYDGTKKALDNGDILNISIEPIGVSVDLIVGQNICTAAGYTNDIGGRWANWVVPSLTTCPINLTAANLLSSNVTFNIRKDSLSKRSDWWGDGTITSTKIGTDLYWYVTNANCISAEKNMDTIPKLYAGSGWHRTVGGWAGNTCAFNRQVWGTYEIDNGAPDALYQYTYAEHDQMQAIQQTRRNSGAWQNYTNQNGTIIPIFIFMYHCFNPVPVGTLDSFYSRTTFQNIPTRNVSYATNPDTITTVYYDFDDISGAAGHYIYTTMFTPSGRPLTSKTFTRYYGYATNSAKRPPSTTVIRQDIYIGNAPNERADIGVNRTLTSITSGINQNVGAVSINGTIGSFTFPTEGLYNLYAEDFITGNLKYGYGYGFFNLFSY
jgi:hypothetical protein